MKIKLQNDKAGYGRTKTVQIIVAMCDGCLQDTMVLSCDSSASSAGHSEYGSVKLCSKCIENALVLGTENLDFLIKTSTSG